MARLVGILANRTDLPRRFAAFERELLQVRAPAGQPLAWGLGFHQNGELLLKRRPIDDRPSIALATMLEDVQSDLVVGHVRRATVGGLRTDNTHPFRYREWLFADTGTVPNFVELRATLLDALPDFLRRSIRGETDSEVVFHLVLAALHRAGALEHPNVAPRDLGQALASAIATLDRVIVAAGHAASHRRNYLLASHEHLVVAHHGAPMAYRTLRGRADLEPLFAEEKSARLRMPDLETCSLVVVASDFEHDALPSGWTAVAEGAMMAFRRNDEALELSPLG